MSQPNSAVAQRERALDTCSSAPAGSHRQVPGQLWGRELPVTAAQSSGWRWGSPACEHLPVFPHVQQNLRHLALIQVHPVGEGEQAELLLLIAILFSSMICYLMLQHSRGENHKGSLCEKKKKKKGGDDRDQTENKN